MLKENEVILVPGNSLKIFVFNVGNEAVGEVDLPASVADWSFARETDCCVGECWTAALWGTPGESNVPDEE